VDPREYRRAIRSARWKYIETADRTDSEQLYDIERDPRERHNLIHRQPAVAAELRGKLAQRLATDEGSDDTDLSPEEREVVEEQLRRLGYL
jgi:arylsulfatase A-like enzyme